jgi:trigger factor
MKVTQEKLPASQVGLEIEIPSDVSQKAYERVIQEFTRSLNIPGFRKGKVPRHVLIQRVGSQRIKQAVIEELVQDSITQAIKETEIAAIGSPQLQTPFEELVQQYEPGSTLAFAAAVDVQPDVKLNQYKDFQVKAEEVPYDPAQVDQVLEDYRAKVATLIPVEGRAAQLGDVAIADYKGLLTGVDEAEADFPGNEAQDFQVELLPGRFIEGFIEGMLGMSAGESKDVSVQFPTDYPMPALAGKSAVFSITLKELKERELPELDDDFAQEISEFETLTELRESLEQKYQREAEQKTRSNKEQALLEALLQHVEVELPETLIRQEVDYLLTQTALRLQNQGMDIKQLFTQEMIPRMREQARTEAISSLKRSLALGEIAKRESIEIDDATLAAKIKEVKSQYQDQEVDEQRMREVLTETLMAEKVMEWLETYSTLELVPLGTLTPQPALNLDDTVEESSTSADFSSIQTETIEVEAIPVEASDVEATVEATEEQTAKKTSATSKSKKKSGAEKQE